MENHERRLLEGALPCARTFLLYGMESAEQETTKAIGELCGQAETLDLRGGCPEAAKLRADLKERFAKSPALVALVGAKLPGALRELLAELNLGQLKLEGDTATALPEGTRLFVLSAEMVHAEDETKPFGLQLVGMRVLKEQRAKVTQAQEDLRRRQERARESSRQHGLV
jgi:hypothetical protein